MADLTKSTPRPDALVDRIGAEIADAKQTYAGGLAALRGPGHATTNGYLDGLDDEAGLIPLGGFFSDETLGATGDSPPPENNVDVRDKIYRRATVVGVASRGDIGKLVFATDDSVLTLTAPSANAFPIGMVIEWHTSTTCDVAMWGMIAAAAIALGGAGRETICLGSFDVTIAASANLATGIVAPCHGLITDLYAVIDGADLVGASGAVDLNLEIGGTNVTGGVVSLVIGSPTAGSKVAGTAITAENRIHQGDLIDVEAVVTTAFTTGRVNLYATIQRELGM